MRLEQYINESVLSDDNLIIKTPDKCSKKEITKFYNLVVKGGQVITGGLKKSIKNAKFLAFYYDDGEIVSIRAIKKAKPAYRDHVFNNAGVDELADKYQYETGWAYTIPSHRRRGIGSFAYKKMLEKAKGIKLFATTRESNIAPQKTLKKNGFKQIGEPYIGITDDNVILWVR